MAAGIEVEAGLMWVSHRMGTDCLQKLLRVDPGCANADGRIAVKASFRINRVSLVGVPRDRGSVGHMKKGRAIAAGRKSPF